MASHNERMEMTPAVPPKPPRRSLISAIGRSLSLTSAATLGIAAGVAALLTWGLGSLLFAPGPLLQWLFGSQPPLGQTSTLDVIKVALSVIAGAGGGVALVIAYRRQKHLEEDSTGRREDAKALRDVDKAYRDRYDSAAQQLGSTEPAVRMAGIYALVNLADEWESQRSQCVDLLCGYLRLPGIVSSGGLRQQVSPAEDELRGTLIRLICSHLVQDAPVSWSQFPFNFRNAYLPRAAFDDVVFEEWADFSHARFTDLASFQRVRFSRGVSFEEAKFTGSGADFLHAQFCERTSFHKAQFTKTAAHFEQALFAGKEVDFSFSVFRNSSAMFRAARIEAESVSFSGAEFSDSLVSFMAVNFVGNDFALSFSNASFSGPSVDFMKCHFSTVKSYLWFSDVAFGSDRVQFSDVDFSECEKVIFQRAKFTSPSVDFEGAKLGRVIFHSCLFPNSDVFANCDVAPMEVIESTFTDADSPGSQAPNPVPD